MEEREIIKKEGLLIKGFPVWISDDDMIIYIPVGKEDKECIKILKELWPKIKNELIKRNFKGVLENPVFCEDKIIIAQGEKPVPPEPARIKFVSKVKDYLSVKEKKPKAILSLKAKELIGTILPFKEGKPGYNVWGDPLSPPEIKEKESFILGENIKVVENTKVIAEKSGVLLFKEEKNKLFLDISPEFTLEGDVDVLTGDIIFFGERLIITGDVKLGFKVSCEGNLEIEGGTENKVKIEVKSGELYIKGITRGEETFVEAEKQATFKGIEQAIIRGENIKIEKFALFCEILSFKEINGENALTYGTILKAGENIIIATAGNESHTKTVLWAGHNQEILNKSVKIHQENMLIKEILKKIYKGLFLAEKLEKLGKLNQEKKRILGKLKEKRAFYEKKLKENEKVLADLFKELEKLNRHIILIKNKIFPGCIIKIAEKLYNITKEIQGPVKFKIDGDYIIFEEAKG